MQICDSVMSQSHLIKGKTTDETFQEQCFLWERGASADFFFFFNFTLKILLHTQEHMMLKDGGKAQQVFLKGTGVKTECE